MESLAAPVLTHHDWQSLLQDFVIAFPEFQDADLAELHRTLTVPASVAWWLVTFHPGLLKRDRLEVVLPGAGLCECSDSGRWMSFLPWLAGARYTHFDVHLVGLQLGVDAQGRPTNTARMSRKRLEAQWQSPLSHLVAERQPATITKGTLGDWRQLGRTNPDVCLLFAPGFEVHAESWLQETELVGLLRSGVPTGILPYSDVDGLVDMFVLKAYGLMGEPVSMSFNPWHQLHPEVARVGAIGQFGWDLKPILPGVLAPNEGALSDLGWINYHLKYDFIEGGDLRLRDIGAKFTAQSDEGPVDAYILPQGYFVVGDTGRVYSTRGEEELTAVDTSLTASLNYFPRPDGELHLVERWRWAVAVFCEHVAPFVL